MQPLVTLKPLYHRGKENIAIVFDYSAELSNTVKKIKDVRWSQTNKCWHLPLCESSYNQIDAVLRSKTNMDATARHDYLKKRQIMATTLVLSDQANVNRTIATSTVWI